LSKISKLTETFNQTKSKITELNRSLYKFSVLPYYAKSLNRVSRVHFCDIAPKQFAYDEEV